MWEKAEHQILDKRQGRSYQPGSDGPEGASKKRRKTEKKDMSGVQCPHCQQFGHKRRSHKMCLVTTCKTSPFYVDPSKPRKDAESAGTGTYNGVRMYVFLISATCSLVLAAVLSDCAY